MTSRKPSMKYDFKVLNQLALNLAEPGYHVKIGILGSKAAKEHKGTGSTNADIGAAHEYGSISKHIPARSFLRMPLFLKANSIVNKVGVRALYWLAKGNKKQILVELGIECEAVIQEAFSSWGFGHWAELKKSTIDAKIGQNPQPLVNTAQLRRSISSQVVQGK